MADKPSQADRLMDSARTTIDAANEARRNFDTSDQRINEASARMLESFAALAEANPAEFFGLKPTERERFLVREVLRPAIQQLSRLNIELPEGSELELDTGDVTGSAGPAAAAAGLAGLSELFKGITDVLKSPQGPAVLEKIFGHIQAEKTFIKDTIKEGLEGVVNVVGKITDFVTGD